MSSRTDPTSSHFLGGSKVGQMAVDPLNLGNRPGGKGGGGPTAPDFTSAVNAQAASGHINQTNPFGSTGWTQGPDGRWTQNTQFSGGLGQGVANLENTIANQNPEDVTNARNQAIESNYSQAASRLDPQWAQREEAQRSQLANQGLDPGSQAYDTAAANLGRERNDAYTSAMNNAIQQGNQTQAVQMQQQNQPYQQLGELNSLMSTGLTGTGPQTQYLPAAMQAYQGALQNYGIQQQGKNSMMGGGSELGAAALLSSDEVLKANVVRSHMEAIPGVPWATWEWKDAPGRRHFGVIAQDLEKVRPDLVGRDASGHLTVNYGGLVSEIGK